MHRTKITLLFVVLSCFIFSHQNAPYTIEESRIISHVVDLNKQQLDLYWKDKNGQHYGSLGNLKTQLTQEKKKLVFAMNGGMYLKDQSPQGLYIEKGVLKKRVNRKKSTYGNFYMQPNGVFYLTKDNKAKVVTTSKFQPNNNIKYATQSGPMLLIEGKIHPKFKKGSSNLHIRNGVGILPNGNLLFAISKQKINFYDFATYFKQNGCQNALYLDGFVSKTYLPEKNWKQLGGNFGVIIGETRPF